MLEQRIQPEINFLIRNSKVIFGFALFPRGFNKLFISGCRRCNRPFCPEKGRNAEPKLKSLHAGETATVRGFIDGGRPTVTGF